MTAAPKKRAPRALDKADLYGLLRREVAKAGGETVFARRHQLSVQYLHDVLASTTSPGPMILDALGLRKVTCYVKSRKKAGAA